MYTLIYTKGRHAIHNRPPRRTSNFGEHVGWTIKVDSIVAQIAWTSEVSLFSLFFLWVRVMSDTQTQGRWGINHGKLHCLVTHKMSLCWALHVPDTCKNSGDEILVLNFELNVRFKSGMGFTGKGNLVNGNRKVLEPFYRKVYVTRYKD